MLSNGEIVKNSEISLEDKKEISSIISYFNSNHQLKDIKALPKDFELDKMEPIIGFKYEPYYSYEQNRYFYYSTNNAEDIIDIKGYDYYVRMNSWSDNKKEVNGLTLQYNRLKNTLSVSKDNRILLEEDITKFVRDIYEKQEAKSPNENKNMLNYIEMSYEVGIHSDVENIDIKFIFTNINGRIAENDNLIVESAEFILLIGNKQ